VLLPLEPASAGAANVAEPAPAAHRAATTVLATAATEGAR